MYDQNCMADVEGSRAPIIGLERAASPESRRLTTSWEKEYMTGDFQTAINITWVLNRPLLDSDYAAPAQVVKDVEESGGPTLALNDSKVLEEVEKRKTQQQAARETNPEKVAAQLGIADLTDGRIQTEIKRRTDLREAFRDLSKIERTIETFNSPQVQERIRKETEKAIEQRLLAINEERKAKSQETLPELSKDERTVIEVQERGRIQAEYYDEETNIYYETRSDGTPDKDKQVDLHTTYKPIFREVKQASEADPKTSGIHPELIAKAKHLRRTTFDYNRDENELVIPSPEKIKAKETLEMAYLCADVVEALLEPSGKSLFVRDQTTGRITDVDQEVLKDLPFDASLVVMARSLADFVKANKANHGTITEGQHNLATLLYRQLKGVDANRLSDRPEFQATRVSLEALLKKGDASFEQRVSGLRDELVDDWLRPENIAVTDISEAAQIMTLSLTVEQLYKKNPNKVDEFLNNLILNGNQLNERQRKAIIALAGGTGKRALSQVFGLDVEAFADPKETATYADEAVNALEWAARERGRPEFPQEKRNAYRTIFKHHFSNEKALEEFAEERGFSRKLIYGALIFALFSPLFQNLLSFDVREGEGGGGSPHG